MKIHVLCLNWNGESLLDPFLSSLFKNLKGIENKVHIRDNGSKDNSINIIKNYPVNLYSIEHNRDSFSDGMNFLYDKSNAHDNDLILLLNNDIIFKSDNNIKLMISLLNKYKAGMVGSKLHYNNGLLSHYGIVLSSKYGNLPWNFKSGEKSTKYDMFDRKFQAVTAACSLIPSWLFKKIGGFCTDYKWCFEDVDLSLKISLIEKLPIICCGQTNIMHGTSVSLKKNPVNKLFMNHNVKIFKEKWLGKYKIDHHLYNENLNYGLVNPT